MEIVGRFKGKREEWLIWSLRKRRFVIKVSLVILVRMSPIIGKLYPMQLLKLSLKLRIQRYNLYYY